MSQVAMVVTADENALTPRSDGVSELSKEFESLGQSNKIIQRKINRCNNSPYVKLGIGLASVISITVIVAILSSLDALQKETKDDIQSYNSVLSADSFVKESLAPSETLSYFRGVFPAALDLELSEGELCLQNSDCLNKVCARESESLDFNLICCPSKNTTQINSEYYCTDIIEETRCVSNDVCASQKCDPVILKCVLKEIAEPCGSDTECIHGICAMAYMWTTNALCCPTSDDKIVDDTDGQFYCAGMEVDAPCLTTKMCNGNNVCLDGFCRENTVVPVQSPTLLPIPTDVPFSVSTAVLINDPTRFPTNFPINDPTYYPTYTPTISPTDAPLSVSTAFLINDPTHFPTRNPTKVPTSDPTIVCSGYFCDKYLHTMFILMTHNSFAEPGKVQSPNQNYDMVTQLQEGIRGFNMDIYLSNDESIYMKHDIGGWPTTISYNDSVDALLAEFTKLEYKHDFILVQFEDYAQHVDKILSPWGDVFIEEFDETKTLGYYISQGKRVLLVSSCNYNYQPQKGIHYTSDLITENEYKWFFSAYNPPLEYRRGPLFSQTSIKLMNLFCGTAPGLGNMISSAIVNDPQRMLYNIRLFLQQSYANNVVNIVMVDYYDTGNIWATQDAVRDGDVYRGCWNDGSLCGVGTTCLFCCDTHEYWYSKALTACGTEPCWDDGTLCGIGTSCNSCCNENEYWYSKALTACGNEPCWSDGTYCLAGTSCNACCNNDNWWVGAAGQHCGTEACWKAGTICGTGTTCKKCCTGNGSADCPWYQLGVCTCS